MDKRHMAEGSQHLEQWPMGHRAGVALPNTLRLRWVWVREQDRGTQDRPFSVSHLIDILAASPTGTCKLDFDVDGVDLQKSKRERSSSGH